MHVTKYDTGVSKFIGNYSDAVAVGPNVRWLITSGTPGLATDGHVPDGIAAQTELVWQNIFAALEAAGMKPTDLVKTTSYLIRPEDVDDFIQVRAKYLQNIRPVGMFLFTPGFTNPKFLVEVEAIAAAP